MAGNGNSKLAAAVLVAMVAVVCAAMIGSAQCALRLTPGVSEGGSGGKAACVIHSSEGASEVAKLTESENINAPAYKPAPEAEVAEGKLEITAAGTYSPKYGSCDGSATFRRAFFFCP